MRGWVEQSLNRGAVPRRLAALTAVVALVVTTTLVLTSLGNADLNPATFTITLPAGTSGQETNKTINLPVAQHADVEIAIDTTASMNTGINDAIAEANALVNGVQAVVPDAQFAVVQFKDFGDDPEYAVEQSMTPSATKVHTALMGLFAGGGGDPPEAYNLVFHNSYADPTNAIGWRDGTRKFVVVIGDAQPHGPVQSEGFSACVDESDDPEGLDTKTELAGMKAAQRTMLMVLEHDRATSTFLPCYKQLAQATFNGGDAVDSMGTGLATDVVNLISAAIGSVQDVHLEVVSASPSPADASWLTLPPALGPVNAPGTYPFGPIGISVPAGTPDGTYTFELEAVADNVPVSGHEIIKVVVPPPLPPSGLIICKSGANGAANQPFSFSVAGLGTAKVKRAAPTAPVTVLGGACSDLIELPAGNYTVAEDVSSGVWQVTDIGATPANALVDSSPANGTATVSVATNGQTKVTFTNAKVPPPPPPGLVICKSGANGALNQPFDFTVTAGTTATTKAAKKKAAKAKAAVPSSPITVDGGSCSDPITLPAGNYTVVEDLSSGLWRVTSITADPAAALIGTPSLATGTAKVSVPATGQTKVTYTNTKVTSTIQVCKWSETASLQGKTYKFTVSGGSLPSAVSVTAKAGATLKKPGCSSAITVDPGSQLTVKEDVPSGQDVTITGAGSATVTDLGNGVAKVKIGPNGNKVVFEDELQGPPPPPPSSQVYLLLCKNTSGAPGEALPYGTIFHFTVDDGNKDHFGPYDVPAWGPPGDETHCVSVLVNPGKVTVTELGPQPNSQLVQIFTRPTAALVAGSVHITPAADWQNPVAGSAQLTVSSTATNAFRNDETCGETQGPGCAPAIHFVDVAVPAETATVEICKKIIDSFGRVTTVFDNDPNAVFTYKIDGVPGTVNVQAGACSNPISNVPLDRDGNFSVTETPADGFLFRYATASGNAGQVTSNPATFHKDNGSFETLITFFNQPAPAGIKVCKKIDAGSTATLGSVAFTFDVYVAGNLVSEVKVKPGACSGVIDVPGGIVGPNGTPKVEVDEQPFPGSRVMGIDVQNAATILGRSARTVEFAPAAGVDIVTFTNTAATPG